MSVCGATGWVEPAGDWLAWRSSRLNVMVAMSKEEPNRDFTVHPIMLRIDGE
jgi:hypothetical protein